jgi:hypothetical protein
MRSNSKGIGSCDSGGTGDSTGTVGTAGIGRTGTVETTGLGLDGIMTTGTDLLVGTTMGTVWMTVGTTVVGIVAGDGDSTRRTMACTWARLDVFRRKTSTLA